LAVAAAREAVAGLDLPAPERIAVLLGTTTGGIEDSAAWYQAHRSGLRADPTVLRRHAASTVTTAVANAIGATGPRLTLSTACSSGANAIALGADLLAAGEADLVIAGGADGLCPLTLDGFSALRLVSDEPCRPFDPERNGLNLGEGAAFVAMGMGSPLAWLSGSACSCDAFHMTAPATDGVAVERAISDALARAGLDPSHIDAINAHGTATRANDHAEAAVFETIFGRAIPPVSATKSFLGHCLGAAGAIEAVLSVLALREQLLPRTANTQRSETGLDLVLDAPRSARLRHLLSTSFAFGGNNAVLVLSHAEAM